MMIDECDDLKSKIAVSNTISVGGPFVSEIRNIATRELNDPQVPGTNPSVLTDPLDARFPRAPNGSGSQNNAYIKAAKSADRTVEAAVPRAAKPSSFESQRARLEVLRKRHAQMRKHFWQSWQANRRYLLSLSLRWTNGDRSAAEDALSAAACKASAHYVRRENNVKNERAWLSRILHNQCMDGHRRNKAEVPSEVETRTQSVEPSPEDLCLNEELRRVLTMLFSELPERLRGPVMLRLVEGESYSAISKVYGLSEDNVRKRVQHGRAILRRRLGRYLAVGEVGTR